MIKAVNIKKNYNIKLGKTLFSKEMKTVEALKSINFEIKDGEIVGILGSNGAGKSTLIKLMTGILTPTSGDIVVDNYLPSKRNKYFLSEIGIMMGNRSSLFYDLPIIDTFKYLQDIYNVKQNDEYNQIIKEFEIKLNIFELLDTPVRKLSLGQRKKAELIAAILHNPKYLFLDEPTIGLDVKSKKEMIDFIKEINKKYKTTIIFTSHDMNDVQSVCKRLIYIDSGTITFDGEIGGFHNYKNTKKIKIIFNKIIENFDDLEANKLDEYTYEFFVDKNKVNEVLSKFSNDSIEEIEITNSTLEEMVLKYD